MGIFVEKNDGNVRIRAEGGLDLAVAAELKDALIEALYDKSPVTLDLGATDEIDLACVQLIFAARRDFVRRDRALSIEDGASLYAAAAAACGFEERHE